jgi:hypothetical protein
LLVLPALTLKTNLSAHTLCPNVKTILRVNSAYFFTPHFLAFLYNVQSVYFPVTYELNIPTSLGRNLYLRGLKCPTEIIKINEHQNIRQI